MSRTHLLPVLMAGLFPAALAGCTQSGADASVHFDGEGNGIDSDDTKCDSKGTLVGSGNVDDGEVTVRVMDGGDELFRHTYDGAIAIDGHVLEGDSGDWTLEATRSSSGELLGDFNGDYTFRLDC